MQRNWLKNKMKDIKRHFQTMYEILEQTVGLKMIHNNLGKQSSRVKWLSWVQKFSGKNLYEWHKKKENYATEVKEYWWK